MAQPYILEVEITVDAGKIDQFVRICLENATSSRREPGCLRFDVFRPSDTTDSVVLFEIYADEAAYEAHRATAHYATFDAARKPLLKAAKRRTFTWANPE